MVAGGCGGYEADAAAWRRRSSMLLLLRLRMLLLLPASEERRMHGGRVQGRAQVNPLALRSALPLPDMALEWNGVRVVLG